MPVRTSRTRELPFRFDVLVALLRGADPAARHGFRTERSLAASSHGGECGVAFGRPPQQQGMLLHPLDPWRKGPTPPCNPGIWSFQAGVRSIWPLELPQRRQQSKRASKRTWKVGPITEYESSSWELTCSYITLKFTKHLPSMI